MIAVVPESGVLRWRREHIGAGVVRVSLSGEIDIASAAEVDDVLRRARDDAAIVVVDLRQLTFIDLFGARTLCAAAARARENGGRLIALHAGPRVESLLALIGIDRYLELGSPPTLPPR